MRRAPLVLSVLVTIVSVLGACGGDDDEPAGESGTTTTEADGTTTTEADDATTTDDDGSTTTDGAPATIDPADLPGEVVEIYPYEGAELWVVGVAADDTLNVRVGPGTDFDVVTELDPLADGLVATGQVRTLDDGSYWVEVEVDGKVGWANRRFVAEPGATTDITSEIGLDLPLGTMEDLADQVAAARAAGGEGEGPDVVVVDGPSAGDLGEITIDVLGYQDDAVLGERLHVFGTPLGSSYGLKSVEATVLCARGVSDGLCV